MKFPKDLKYTKNDEWIRVEGNLGTVGITDYAQEQLSDIVYVEIILEEGNDASKGDSCATIESVKAAAEVYLPVSGKVVAINNNLPNNTEAVNTDPYGAAWMVQIELSDRSELDSLLDSAGYESHIASKA